MDTLENFIKANKDKREAREVNLTHEQIDIIERVAEVLGLSFEDCVMALMQAQLSDIGEAFYKQILNQSARRN